MCIRDRTLVGDRRCAEAIKFADEKSKNYTRDVRFDRMRAESYAGPGRRSQKHRALAERSVLKGETEGGIEQLELAQRAGDANFYELAVIDGRLREMKKRQIEEMKERPN